MIIVIGPF